jgi:ferritin-like metal-binding protein YciE
LNYSRQINYSLQKIFIMATLIKQEDALQTGDTLNGLFIGGLKNMYWSELRLATSLSNMAPGAASDDLKNAIQPYLEQTENHADRLRLAFLYMGEATKATKCGPMDRIIKEAETLMDEMEEGTEGRDIALLSAIQEAEHYKIANYETMQTVAQLLGYSEAAELLNATLQEEQVCGLLAMMN